MRMGEPKIKISIPEIYFTGIWFGFICAAEEYLFNFLHKVNIYGSQDEFKDICTWYNWDFRLVDIVYDQTQ